MSECNKDYIRGMETLRKIYKRILENESTKEERLLLFDSWFKSCASNEWLLWSLLDTEEEPSEKEVAIFLEKMGQILVNDI